MSGQLNNSFLNEFEPSEFYLSQNFPNPFKKKTVIKYCVASKTRIRLTVYDTEGKETKILVDEEQNPGTYEVEFCIAQDSSTVKSSKTYFYRLEAGDYESEKKMQLIK